MLLHKNPNLTKFCGNRLKNAGDIRDRKFVLPEKVGQSSHKFLGDVTPKTSHHAKFIEIGQTSLEIGVRCPQRQQRQRVTEGTAVAPWNGPNNFTIIAQEFFIFYAFTHNNELYVFHYCRLLHFNIYQSL